MKKIYLIGSLKARAILYPIEAELKSLGYDVFIDWLAPGVLPVFGERIRILGDPAWRRQ